MCDRVFAQGAYPFYINRVFKYSVTKFGVTNAGVNYMGSLVKNM